MSNLIMNLLLNEDDDNPTTPPSEDNPTTPPTTLELTGGTAQIA